MKKLSILTFFLLVIAAGITVAFVGALKPSSRAAFMFFAIWLMTPYIVMMGVLAYVHSRGLTLVSWHVVAWLVSVGGVLFLADVIFWHPDAQGAIAVLMTPLLQAATSGVLLILTSWLLRERKNA